MKKALVPELRFPEFRDAGEWEEYQLGQCLVRHPEYGINAPAVPYSDNLPTYLRITDISDDGNFLRNPRVSVAKKVNDENYLDEGDIVLARTGASVGKSYKYKRTDGRLVFAGFLIRVRPNEGKLNSELFFQFLSTEQYWRWVDFSSARSGQPGINGNEYASLPLPLPPTLNEQQKIADCLSSIDELITAQTQKLGTLKAHKKGLMQQLFPAEGETVPKLRFPEFRDVGEWEINPLGKVGNNLDSKRVPITGKDRVKGHIPYYGASGIIDYVQEYIFDEYLLCISEDGANLVARTYPIAFSICGKTWVNNHAHVMKFEHAFTQIIIENYLNSINLEDYLTGMAQPKLNRAKLDIIPIPLPKIDEQQKISDCLSSIDELISAQTQKLGSLKAHKKGLMQQLFPSMDEVTV